MCGGIEEQTFTEERLDFLCDASVSPTPAPTVVPMNDISFVWAQEVTTLTEQLRTEFCDRSKALAVSLSNDRVVLEDIEQCTVELGSVVTTLWLHPRVSTDVLQEALATYNTSEPFIITIDGLDYEVVHVGSSTQVSLSLITTTSSTPTTTTHVSTARVLVFVCVAVLIVLVIVFGVIAYCCVCIRGRPINDDKPNRVHPVPFAMADFEQRSLSFPIHTQVGKPSRICVHPAEFWPESI
eukprot:m.112768 g.112768  ORF g.112768 m.112768 type:complete len:239 (+) comp28218_c1_seq2:614-1330(+)